MRRWLAVVLFIWALVFSTPVLAGATTWTEDWSGGTAQWSNTSGCSTAGGILHATASCSPQAFSQKRWSQLSPVAVSTTVRGQPVGSTPYFCGLALYRSPQVYAQAAVGREVNPTYFPTPNLIFWNNETKGKYQYLGFVAVDNWNLFTVRWDPSNGGVWSAIVNGTSPKSVHGNLDGPLLVDLQGGPSLDDGSECQFGPVTVTGVQL